jgi:D-glycero-alpha-D-manno-heptose 1-phosphate guanylyltransferase
MRIDYSVEDKPLGTGGAIRKALKLCYSENVLVLNGDTYFDVDLNALNKDFQNSKADIVLAAKRMYDFSRYGALKLDDDGRVVAFLEKALCNEGLINGGIYIIRSNLLVDCSEVFSMEAFLQSNAQSIRLFASENDGYFIDIGIPEDYAKAQHDFQQRSKNL